MERRFDRPPPSRPPRNHRRSSATPAPLSSTFSSSLLDSIYRSMGDDPSSYFLHLKPTTSTKDHYIISRPPRPRETYSATLSRRFNEQPRSQDSRTAAARVKEKPYNRWLIPSSSSSSDGSSCTGFSSDDSSRLSIRLKLKPVKTTSSNQPNRTDEKKIKKQPPASPGARIARFISSLFSTAEGGQKKHRSAVAAAAESCSSARSCMNRSAAAEKKKVSFKAAYSDQELRRTGFHCSRRSAAPEKLIRMRSARSGRGFLVEEEEDERSDASSDLFELEIPTVGKYTDELPVYGGTRISKF